MAKDLAMPTYANNKTIEKLMNLKRRSRQVMQVSKQSRVSSAMNTESK